MSEAGKVSLPEMMPERKEEIKSLLEAATPGAWQAEGKEVWRRKAEDGGEFYAGAIWITDVEHEGNRNLVAAAPMAIAELPAALEEAQQVIKNADSKFGMLHEELLIAQTDLREAQP